MSTKISWTDETWNPVTGCSRVSPGCEHCYAETLSLRYGWSKKPWKAQFAAENVILHPERLNKPRSWKKPSRCFVNSMSDLFHEQVPFEYIDRVFAVMVALPQHTFQVLTKRPERMREYMRSRYDDPWTTPSSAYLPDFPPENVWLGTSVEDQRRADERIPVLLDTLAAVRFLSCEPLLGSVDLTAFLWKDEDVLQEYIGGYPRYQTEGVPTGALHWVIVGGESGPGFRPMDLDWARQLRDQCEAALVPFFYKQSSGRMSGMNPTLGGVEWHQFPGATEQATLDGVFA
jgi:protein gp37